MPVAIEGFYEAWPRHKRFPKIADLQLVFGKPIQPPPLSEASEAAYEQLTAELKSRVVAMWQELRANEGRKTSSGGAEVDSSSDSKDAVLAGTR